LAGGPVGDTELMMLTTGVITRQQWCAEIGRRVASPEAADEWLAEPATVDHEMMSDVDRLRAAGYTVAILTNGTDTIADEMTSYGIADRFDAVFNSAEIGFVKPDRRVFEHVCSSLDVNPTEVFFTDDSESKLAGAIELGMTVYHFVGVETFRRHLAEHGLG
jgi:putative hydrolase of the HAD superfamily